VQAHQHFVVRREAHDPELPGSAERHRFADLAALMDERPSDSAGASFLAMGVPVGSMTLAQLSEAIPPAHSRFVAKAF
jgi:hypothetical protein